MFGKWFWLLSAYGFAVCLLGTLAGSILVFPLSTNLLIAAVASILLRKVDALSKRRLG